MHCNTVCTTILHIDNIILNVSQQLLGRDRELYIEEELYGGEYSKTSQSHDNVEIGVYILLIATFSNTASNLQKRW